MSSDKIDIQYITLAAEKVSESTWYDNPITTLAIGAFIGFLLTFISNFFRDKRNNTHQENLKRIEFQNARRQALYKDEINVYIDFSTSSQALCSLMSVGNPIREEVLNRVNRSLTTIVILGNDHIIEAAKDAHVLLVQKMSQYSKSNEALSVEEGDEISEKIFHFEDTVRFLFQQ